MHHPRRSRAVRLLLCGVLATTLRGADLHVAPTGADTNPGTAEAPFATLEAVRDAARRLIATRPADGVTVWLHDGTWMRRGPLELGPEDAGTAAAPVTWRARAGARPRLCGGIPVPADALQTVDDPAIRERLDATVRDRVRRIDCAALGINRTGPLPDLFADGGGILRLFAGDKPLPLARWPDEGYSRMDQVLDGGTKDRGGAFTYRGDRPARWAKAVDEGLWVAGFWRVPWVIQAVRVAGIAPDRHAITHAVGVPGGIGSKYSKEVNGSRVGNGAEPWYVLNVLEELDRPGEWCLDARRKAIYLLPPADGGSLMIVDDDRPLIHCRGTAHLTVQGLTLHAGLGTGLRIDGGEAVRVLGCTISDSGREGLVVAGGRNHLIQSNDLTGSGSRPVLVEGGERKSLTTSGHQVLNNHVHHYGTVQWVVPGIEIRGVGVRLANNLIHDGPNSGILFAGNDHLIEHNEVHNIGLDSGDLGCIYAVLDWASRGTRIRQNLLHHTPNGQGIYLDDGKSGDEVTGNIIIGTLNGVFLSGGHDMLVAGNLIIDSRKAAVHVDDRGVARGYNANSKGHVRLLHEYGYQRPPWSTHYPELTRIIDFHPELPTGITIAGNVFVGGPKDLDLPAKPERRQFITVGRNLRVTDNAGFTAPERLDYSPRVDSPIAKERPDLALPPLARLGLQVDAWRRTLPTDEATGRLTARPPRMVFDSAVDLDASNKQKR